MQILSAMNTRAPFRKQRNFVHADNFLPGFPVDTQKNAVRQSGLSCLLTFSNSIRSVRNRSGISDCESIVLYFPPIAIAS